MKTLYVLHECPTTWTRTGRGVVHSCYLNEGHPGTCRCACDDVADDLIVRTPNPAGPVDREDPLKDLPPGCRKALAVSLALFAGVLAVAGLVGWLQ